MGRIADRDLVIYELNVRTFTASPTSGCRRPGTFEALGEKIPYLKSLGINAVELLPVFEFDSTRNTWGYSSSDFFSPKSSYGTPSELKRLIGRFHENGIEVILDVVYNHTPECGRIRPEKGWHGLSAKDCYILTEDGRHLDFTGCRNTFNCNNPKARRLIVDSLRHWTVEYGVDGFRFDLAPILERGEDGTPLGDDAPLIKEIMGDPILKDVRLIAEPWDAAGLYRLGAFSRRGRWNEWNDRFRDSIRCFLKSDEDIIPGAIECIDGTTSVFTPGGPMPINFITAHDGFTLMDLVSYNTRHNMANGENGMDGAADNMSWNCGTEGPTDDKEINSLRKSQIKNFITLLLLSRGIPMVTAGDEAGRTQHGNNNPYCIDDGSVWFDWTCIERNKDILEHFKYVMELRNRHPELNSYTAKRTWSGEFRTRTLTVEEDGKGICLLINTHWEGHDFILPEAAKWKAEKKSVTVGPRSISVLEF